MADHTPSPPRRSRGATLRRVHTLKRQARRQKHGLTNGLVAWWVPSFGPLHFDGTNSFFDVSPFIRKEEAHG